MPPRLNHRWRINQSAAKKQKLDIMLPREKCSINLTYLAVIVWAPKYTGAIIKKGRDEFALGIHSLLNVAMAKASHNYKSQRLILLTPNAVLSVIIQHSPLPFWWKQANWKKQGPLLLAGREQQYNLLTHKSSVQRALIRNSLKFQTRRQVCK